ncbi:MAG: DUF362 domain-containing protein [Chitinispirillales bacterium]|nr:DUF362 domain-containing protein [Chitinispirillales bacterium]
MKQKSTVAIVKCSSYDDQELETAVNKGLALLGGVDKFASPKEKILFKPNILWPTNPDKCVVTHPAVFKAVLSVFKSTGASLFFGDSSGGLQSPESALKKSGHFQAAQPLGAELADFVNGESVSYPAGVTSKRLLIAKGVLDADGVISLPKLKTHILTRMTGAVKNQYGCVPGMGKGQYHAQFPDLHDFSKLLVDICGFVNPRLYIMDAVMGMEGNGPQSGDPRHIGALIFSTDPVALDAVAAGIIDLDPSFIPTSTAGLQAGLGTYKNEDIELLGDPLEQFVIKDYKVVKKPVQSIPETPFLKNLKRLINPAPVIDKKACTRCGRCIDVCPVEPKAVGWKKGSIPKKSVPVYNYRECIRCYCCHEMCPSRAINVKKPFLGRCFPFLSYIALLMSSIFAKRNDKTK